MQVINTNVMSLNSQRQLNKSQSAMGTALERLSSGLRINRAKDDAAGLAISEQFSSQIRGLNQAVRNANDGISLVQTAEGALDEIGVALQRMRELAVQSANGIYTSANRSDLNKEYQQLASEIKRIATNTDFNGVAVLSNSAMIYLQVGWKSGQYISISGLKIITSITSAISGASIGTQGAASQAIGYLDSAIQAVASNRATFGAKQNRLESAIRNLENVAENQSAARSRIRDADFAAETAEMTRTQILQQAGVAMLAQANQLPQNVLSLLR